MIMITKKNEFSGANFDYENEKKTCTATGEYRHENGVLESVNINGQFTQGKTHYNFWANCDAAGNVNISGVPVTVIAGVASEVATIISEIKAE